MLLLRLNPTFPSPPQSPLLPLKIISPKPPHLPLPLPRITPPLRPLSSARRDPFVLPSTPLRHLEPYLLRQWSPILQGWLCSAVSVLCLSRAVPKVGRLPAILAGGATPARMAEMGAPLLALGLVNCVANYLQQAFLWEAALGAVCEVQVDVFEMVLGSDLRFFEGSSGVPAGDVAYRITAEASDVVDTVYALLNMIVPCTLQLAAMTLQMVIVSPVLSLASALIIPGLCFGIAYLGENLRKISQTANISVASLSSYLNEVLPSMLVVKANNAEAKEILRFQILAKDSRKSLLMKRKMKAFIPQLIQILCIGGLFTFCACSILISGGSLDCSVVVSFVTSLTLLAEPIKGVGKAYNELKQGEPAVKRLFELTKFKSELVEKPDAVELKNVAGDIKFCNVTFSYGDGLPLVLNNINLHIKPGETVALVGQSGGGKSTLAKLLLRFYSPTSGCILVDDHDIHNIKLKNLRRNISLVSQDIVLFTGTVAENIAYKDLMGNFDMEHVENAARIANADEFIRKLPDGYNTNVGPKGSRLSGGQRQRLAIARSLYQKCSILILDEATSALDSTSELLFREALGRLMSNHTVLVIAHRLETILMADRILLLESGSLEEISRSAFLARDGRCNSLLSSALVA